MSRALEQLSTKGAKGIDIGLAFTNGKGASMYGKGGTEYAWHDPPSFAHVTSLITRLLPSATDHGIAPP